MILIPIIFFLFYEKGKAKGLRLLLWIIGWYVAAKLLEHYDVVIFRWTGLVSGHTLKHLAAAAATGYMVAFYQSGYLSLNTRTVNEHG
jgi:hypothetical protein